MESIATADEKANTGTLLYRYYQQSEYDIWRTKEDKDPTDPWTFANEANAERVSIMCVSEDFDIAADKSAIKYAGNLFFDIDDINLNVALKSANQLVAKLLALGVDAKDIECHLSGKKGVHIYLNQKIFCRDQAYLLLPEIYARLAMHLWVDGMDFQVYSAGKGRMIRPVNARRPDGNYKVQISVEELRDMVLEDYKTLVSGPRDTLEPGPMKWAPKLAKIFSTCKEVVSAPISGPKPVPPADLAKLGGLIPSCVEMLSQGKRKKIKGDGTTSFNALAMQVGCWSKYSNIEPVLLEGLHERIAKHNPSSSDETKESRVRKLSSMHHYLKTQEKYTFSCGAIKKLVDGVPECSSCPVFAAAHSSVSVAESLFLVEHHGHYYADKDKTLLVAPFTMYRDAIVIDEHTNKVKTSTVIVNVPLSGESYRLKNFSEDAWISKNNLKKELSGLDGVSFFGSDNDVARLRMTLSRDDLLNGAEVKQVYAAMKIGLEYRKRSGPESVRDPAHKGRLIYIEPGFSLNDVGVQGTHVLTSDEPPAGAPNMKIRDFNEPMSNKANEALALLYGTNTPGTVATMLGWFIATHLKSHFYAIEHRFPLLCLSGVAGTGKNSSVAVMMRLCGVEGERALLTLEVPQATQFPFQQALSDSSTIPRVINEMNPKSVSTSQYRRVLELLKAAFDSQNISRGRIGGGDRSTGLNVSSLHWKITAPLVVLSEEPIGEPAVLHRAIMVNLTPAGLAEGRKPFLDLERRADDLADVGRILIREALMTPIQEVIAILDSAELPEAVQYSDIPERLKYGYKVVTAAYTWAIRRLENSGMNESNYKKLKKMQKAFLASIAEVSVDISRESRITEVDIILRTLAIIALNSSKDAYGEGLVKGFHFAVLDGLLYLDVQVAYPVLQAYKKRIGESLGIQTPEAFMKVVKSMDYYVSDLAMCPLLPTQGRSVLSLSMDIMADRSIPVTMFM